MTFGLIDLQLILVYDGCRGKKISVRELPANSFLWSVFGWISVGSFASISLLPILRTFETHAHSYRYKDVLSVVPIMDMGLMMEK